MATLATKKAQRAEAAAAAAALQAALKAAAWASPGVPKDVLAAFPAFCRCNRGGMNVKVELFYGET